MEGVRGRGRGRERSGSICRWLGGTGEEVRKKEREREREKEYVRSFLGGITREKKKK